MSKLVVALAQINPVVGDVRGNADRCMASYRAARAQHGAEVVVLPELALLGCPHGDLVWRAGIRRQLEQELARLAAAVEEGWLIVGYPRATETGLVNVAGVLHRGQVVAEYAAHRLVADPAREDCRYYVPGRASGLVRLGELAVGLVIGSDLDGPAVAAEAAASGAGVLIHLNASPWLAGQPRQREETLQQRARETGLAILSVNQAGGSDEWVYDGGSVALDASGVRARAGWFQPDLLAVELQSDAGRWQLSDSPPPELPPEPVAMRYQALVTGLRDYVEKNGFGRAMLGLSGGIDSALSLAIAVDALGADRVEAVMMPFRYTADMSREDAAEQARRQGVRYREWPIEAAHDSLLDILAEAFAGRPADLAEQNLQARIRGTLLMALSNKLGGLVLTTSNKSELAVGYTTLYGDMAGGFCVLKDAYKTEVFELARYRNRLGEVIPPRVLVRPPSAELSPDQLDIDSLPPYAVLDDVLRRHLEQGEEAEELIASGHDEAMVHRILGQVARNEYKRRQAAPGVRLTRSSLGSDRRMPITSGWPPRAPTAS